MSSALDPRLTFDRLRVGPHNRDAVETARRVADDAAPEMEMLVIHGPGGVGKTHLLVAAAHRARSAHPEIPIRYYALAEWAARGGRNGDRDDGAVGEGGLLLLDDVDALEGVPAAQLELLRILGLAQRAGTRVVATSARLPAEITALDPRLRDRLARGGSVALAFPGMSPSLAPEAPDPLPPSEADEFGAFLSDITSTVAELVEAAPWRRSVANAIRHWEGEGFRTRRLEAALDGDTPPDVEVLVSGFAADAEALLRVERDLARLDPAGTLGRPIRDPDRRAEAEALLARARAAAPPPAAPAAEAWFFNAEKIALGWVGIGERIVEEWG